MKKSKWLGCLLPIVVGCLLIPAYLATHLSSTPDLAEEYNHRDVAKFGLGDKQGAISDYDFPKGTLREQATIIDPEDAFAYYNRGVAKFESGDKQGAILDFDRVIAINPQDAEAYSNRGVAKFGLGDQQGAIADLTKGAELFRQQGKMANYQKIIELIRQFKQSGGSMLPLLAIVTAI
jgi:tetratricopeptide (TPR) repeat protein